MLRRPFLRQQHHLGINRPVRSVQQIRHDSSATHPRTNLIDGYTTAAVENVISRDYTWLWETVHSTTHLSWFWTLPVVALMLRGGVYYFLTRPSRRQIQKMADLRNVIHARTLAMLGPNADYSKMKSQSRDEIERQKKNCYKEWEVTAWKRFLPLFQIVPWFAMMEGLRGILGIGEGLLGHAKRGIKNLFGFGSGSSAAEVTTNSSVEGFDPATKIDALQPQPAITPSSPPIDPELLCSGPFSMDLTALDTTGVLPLLVPMIMLTNGLWGLGILTRERTFAQLGRFSRAMLLLPIPMCAITLQIPAGMLWFWFWSSSFGLASTIYSDRKYPMYHQGGKGFKPLRKPFRAAALENNV